MGRFSPYSEWRRDQQRGWRKSRASEPGSGEHPNFLHSPQSEEAKVFGKVKARAVGFFFPLNFMNRSRNIKNTKKMRRKKKTEWKPIAIKLTKIRTKRKILKLATKLVGGHSGQSNRGWRQTSQLRKCKPEDNAGTPSSNSEKKKNIVGVISIYTSTLINNKLKITCKCSIATTRSGQCISGALHFPVMAPTIFIHVTTL